MEEVNEMEDVMKGNVTMVIGGLLLLIMLPIGMTINFTPITEICLLIGSIGALLFSFGLLNLATGR